MEAGYYCIIKISAWRYQEFESRDKHEICRNKENVEYEGGNDFSPWIKGSSSQF